MQNLIPKDYSKCARAHTHRGTRTHKHCDYTKLNIHSLKTGSKCPGDLEWIKTHRTEIHQADQTGRNLPAAGSTQLWRWGSSLVHV